MFIHNSFLNAGSSLFVSVNSTNQYVATASIDGNISIRSVRSIAEIYRQPIPESNGNGEQKELIPAAEVTVAESNSNAAELKPKPEIAENTTNSVTYTSTSKYTKPLHEVSKTPEFDPFRITTAQRVLNIVGVRSRSKITSLRYANLSTNANLLAAVYKNGEVYIVTNPQDINKCRIQQIFKHVNGLLLDFSWSADDQLMAFTSMNNEVIIYDVIYGKIISNLHLHENTEVINSKDGTTEQISIPVKGVAFDKTQNCFLVTLGDDRALNIVKYRLVNDEILGRKIEYSIVKEFDGIINSAKLNKATIKKLSFSPDDVLISCPNTSKSRTMKVTLVSKDPSSDGWKISKQLVAHGYKSFMTVFSPCVYRNEKGEIFYVLASLSTDSALSIWRTDKDIPVYAVTDLAPSILDFCWSSDGSMIFLTPQNGSMIVAVFKENEFGIPLYQNNELTLDLHKKTRELLPIEFEKMTKWRSFMNDHPQLVKQKEQEILDAELRKIKVKPAEIKQLSATPTEQPKVKGETLPPLNDKKENLQEKDTDKDKAKEKEKEKEAEKEKVNEKEKNKETNGEEKTKDKEPKQNTPIKDKSTKSKPAEDQHADNEKAKKDTKDSKPGNSPPQKGNKNTQGKPDVENSKKRPISTSNYDLPSNSVPKDLNSKVVKMMKKDSVQSANSTNSNANITGKKKRDAEPIDFVGAVAVNPQISFSNIRIAIPKLRTKISYRLPDDKTYHLTVRNGNGFESQPTRISLSKEISKIDSKQIFVDFLPHKIHIVSGSFRFWALSTPTGQVLAYTESGRRVLPAMVLGSPLSFLEMKNQFLLAVTCTGELYVWDLDKKISMFKPISLYPLLQPIYSSGQSSSTSTSAVAASADNNESSGGNVNVNMESNGLVFVNGELLTRSENLTICSITAQGIPIVTLSNGNGYLFNKDMNTWSLISDSWWAFGSQYWDSSMSVDSLKNVSLLEYMESHTNDEINRRGKAKFFSKVSKMMLMREGYENLETIISLNHLENKINFYLYLKDYSNYKMFLIIYAKRLSELNLKNRLLEILQSLFIDRNGKICGHSKKELLEELLLSCSKHREVQHILVQYSESIGLLPEADDSDIDIL
ncbi:hypothetical protein PMKS-002283 [Pichia membranifaciens]|uniref:Protein HIR n=1 Tax=Pichia membranifaciens TaxID=4926 RepID=A0A1Q2YGX8_9ASCO|nr:hypothetical protein PMKS-002283 [Pichia membranifaciens]